MTKSKLAIFGLVSAVFVSGCSTTPMSTVGFADRDAVDGANNKQIVSTQAVPGAPVLHPQMNAAAIERYLNDSVKKPESGGSFNPGG